MFKKKQARFSVSIPYELRENKLWIQSIAWPDKCPCCNEKLDAALGTHNYKDSARYSQISTGTQTRTTFFPLEWEGTYWSAYHEHMKIAENWRVGIIATVIFVPMILILAIDASSTMLFLLMYALFIAGGLALLKIIIATAVKSKLKPTCLDFDLAFWVSSPPTAKHKNVFNFDLDEYAETFSLLNSAELEINP